MSQSAHVGNILGKLKKEGSALLEMLVIYSAAPAHFLFNCKNITGFELVKI